LELSNIQLFESLLFRMALARASRLSIRHLLPQISNVMNFAGESGGDTFGRGAGRGGGGGGSIREAGGAFGELEAARENEYFHKLQKLQLKGLREQLHDEVEFHERHLKHHQEAIDRHKKRAAELAAEEKELEKSKK